MKTIFVALGIWSVLCTVAKADAPPVVATGSSNPSIATSAVTAPLVARPIDTSQLTITDPTGRPLCRIDGNGAMWFDALGMPWASLVNAGGFPALCLMGQSQTGQSQTITVSLGPGGPSVAGIDGTGRGFVVDSAGYRAVVPNAGGAK